MVALDFTPAQEESFKATFRARRRLLLGLCVPLFLGFLLVLLETSGSSDMAVRLGLPGWSFPAAGLALGLGVFGVGVWAWRCPACRAFLAVAPSPSYCRTCGCPLD